jgi:hypothetical protein
MRVTYTEYINCNGSKDAHEDKGLIVSTDYGEEKCTDSKEDTEHG